MKLLQLLASAITLNTFAAAWPWPEDLEGDAIAVMAMQQFDNYFFRRQDESSTANGDNTASITSSAAASATASNDGSDASASGSGSRSGTATRVSGSASRSKSGSSSETTEYDPRLPPGGISMITPAAISGSQFYKIGDYVTFAWNYTSLSSTPAYIDILATCTANQATYTLATNQSAQQTGILWDTGAYQSSATVPLLTETYTLIIYDADSSISAVPRAGYLAPFRQMTFGMYTPQPYTPLSEYTCATCSGALSMLERQTLGFMLGMTTITVVTFTYFASSFGIF